MPISEQTLLTKLDKLKVEQVQAALESLKIKGPTLNGANASTILLHVLASEEETNNKLSLVRHLFCLDQESENDLFQIMSFILQSHRSKIEFNFEMDYNTNALVSCIKSTSLRANEVVLCHLALYLSSQRIVSLSILEILLHAAYGNVLDIAKRREAVKYIQQIDLTPFAYQMDHTFSCLLDSETDELRLGTSLESLFSVINNYVDGTDCWSYYVLLSDKMQDENIVFSLDEKTKTISFTLQNKNYTYEIKSNDIFLRLMSSRSERVFYQSKFRPVMSPETLKIIGDAFWPREEKHFIKCMEMLKTLPNDKLKQLAARFHEVKDLQKMISKELRSRQASDPLTALKNRFKYFVFLENYHNQYPNRSIKNKDIKRELGNDCAQMNLPSKLQQIIKEAIEYVNTKELIYIIQADNRYKLFKATHLKSPTISSNSSEESTQPENIDHHIARVAALRIKTSKALAALSVDELLTINNQLIPYPEIRKAVKKFCLARYTLEENRQALTDNALAK